MSENSNTSEFATSLEELDEANNRMNFLYALGEKVSLEMAKLGVNPNNPYDTEAYFECLPPQHEQAWAFYEDTKIRYASPESATPFGQLQQTSAPATSALDAERSARHDPPIDELLNDWIAVIRRSMKASSFPEYQRMGRFFGRVVTHLKKGKSPPISAVDEHLIREYKKILRDTPKTVKTDGYSIEALTNQGGARKSKTTVYKTCVNVGTFLKWALGEGYPVNPKAIDTLKANNEVKTRDKKRRVPFDDSDLKKIFESQKYRDGDFRVACDYWLPLLGLFTGASLGELVQLDVSDVRKSSGFWVLDINAENDKELKEDDGRPRLIPVHDQLLKLGFLVFVEFQRSQGHGRLFPEEKRSKRNLFQSTGKRFRYFRDQVGAGPRHEMEMRDFHSYRHLVQTRLEEADVSSGTIDEIIGHKSEKRSVGQKVYSHSDFSELNHKAMKKLKYDLDYSAICCWKRCKFMIPVRKSRTGKAIVSGEAL